MIPLLVDDWNTAVSSSPQNTIKQLLTISRPINKDIAPRVNVSDVGANVGREILGHRVDVATSDTEENIEEEGRVVRRAIIRRDGQVTIKSTLVDQSELRERVLEGEAKEVVSEFEGELWGTAREGWISWEGAGDGGASERVGSGGFDVGHFEPRRVGEDGSVA